MGESKSIFGDGIGYVVLLEKLGDQYSPAEDARMSTGKGRLDPTKDLALEARLLRDGHTSPFEGIVVKFEVCAPLFVVRELDRHRTTDKLGEEELTTPQEDLRKWFSRNEMSGRYVVLPDTYYHPREVRGQSGTNKQGTGQDAPSVDPSVSEEFLRRGRHVTEAARNLYDWAAKQGIERGLARIYNTQNQYTKVRYTGSLKNWLDFLKLRLPEHVVLWECRMVAEAIERHLIEQFPDLMRMWREQVFESVRLTKEEVEGLARLVGHVAVEAEMDHVKRAILKLRGSLS